MQVPNHYRITDTRLGSRCEDGNNGAFLFKGPITGRDILAIASDGEGWEHVSVSVRQGRKARTPTWEEMSFVKELFWGEEEVVMQLHPPRSEWISNHDNVLHLWKPICQSIPRPESFIVGVKGISQSEIERKIDEVGPADAFNWLLEKVL